MLTSLSAVAALATAVPGGAPPPQNLPGVAVERRLAERLGLEIGDTLRLSTHPADSGWRFVVRASFAPRPDPATVLRGEYRIRLHLPDLADLLGHPDRVDRIAVQGRPGIGPDSLAALVNSTAFGYRAFPSTEIASESSRTFLVVSRFHRAIGLISIVASAVFLLCIMLLKVEERRLDAAMMRMIGIGRATVFRAFLLEAVLVAAVGSAVGTALAYLAGAVTNAVYQRRFATGLIFSLVTPEIIALGVGLSLGLGVLVGALAAARLVRTDPLTLWRRRA